MASVMQSVHGVCVCAQNQGYSEITWHKIDKHCQILDKFIIYFIFNQVLIVVCLETMDGCQMFHLVT